MQRREYQSSVTLCAGIVHVCIQRGLPSALSLPAGLRLAGAPARPGLRRNAVGQAPYGLIAGEAGGAAAVKQLRVCAVVVCSADRLHGMASRSQRQGSTPP